MSMIDQLNSFERIVAGRPHNGWRLQPFAVTDGNLHHLIPGQPGQNLIIREAIMCVAASTRVTVEVRDTAANVLFRMSCQYENMVLPFPQPLIVPLGRGIDVQRVIGNADSCTTMLGYIDVVDIMPTLFIGI